MDPIRVLVTGVGGGSIGEQVCKALRLGRQSYRLTVANTSRGATRVVRADAVEELPPASAADYPDRLLGVVRKHAIQFVVPGSEPELVRLAGQVEPLAAAGVRLLINSPQVIATCVDKRLCFDTLARNGFHVPRTVEVDQARGRIDPPMAYPCIVKPSQGGGGSAGTFIAQDDAELDFFVGYLLKDGRRPLVQEYVADAENEYTVGVLHGPAGQALGTVVLKRQILTGLSNRLRVANRSGRPEMGRDLAVSSGISQGEIVEFAPVRETAERIARAIGSTGPLNIQGRWDGARFVPFEINPRFSGTTPMRALAGFNEPELLIEAWLGIERPEGPAVARAGTCIRGLTEYFTPRGSDQLLASA